MSGTDSATKIDPLWERYQAAEKDGLRREALQILRDLLSALKVAGPEDKQRWVNDLLHRKFDLRAPIPLPFPLFEQVVLPEVIRMNDSGDPTAAKRLAQMNQLLFRARAAWESLGFPGNVDLWREAFRKNPGDEEVRQGLVKQLLDSVRYSLHELPSGVLFGSDGATAKQCEMLQLELEELRRLLNLDESNAHSAELDRAQFHYRAYPRYLAGKVAGAPTGYAEFLSALHPKEL
jgi:hypothetical protein